MNVALRPAARAGVWTLLAMLGLALLLINARTFPAPWYDEGLFTSLAASLSRGGAYRSNGGGGILTEGTGPAVTLPVALAVRAFGETWSAARAPIVAFSVLGLLAHAVVARRLFGFGAAVLASGLLLAGSPEFFVSYVYLSRQVLGEIPAIAFYLAGLLCLLSAFTTQRTQLALLGGLCWAGAMLAKPQYVPMLLAATALLVVADQWYYRVRLTPLVLMCGGLAGAIWLLLFALQGPNPGMQQVTSNARGFADGARVVALAPTSLHWRTALGSLWRSGFLIVGLPGLVWGLWRASNRTRLGAQFAITLALPLAWGAWFISLSLGWSRYAFPLHALSLMWTASLLMEVGRRLRARLSPAIGTLGLAAVVACVAGLSAGPLLRSIMHPPDSGYDAAHAALEQLPEARIVSWEWQMDLGSRHRFVHPSYATGLVYIQRMMAGLTVDDAPHGTPDGDYLLVGPFGAWTGYYSRIVGDLGPPVFSAGQYTLFRIGTLDERHASRPAGNQAP